MAGTFKIGTFNCANLFSRPKVLNREDRKVGDEKMAKIDLLREELEKEVYDGKKIVDLYHEVSDFIEIIEVREKLFSKSKKKGLTLKVKGRKDWDGFIQYKRDKFNDNARKNTAKVINTINVDIVSLIEVEDKRTLDSYNSALIKRKFDYSMLIDAFDPRGIDVALLSRFPFEFEDIRTHMFDKKGKSRIFSRDCLEVKIKLAASDFIYFLVNHFKSQGYGLPKDNDARRLPQTQRVVDIIKERKLDLQKDKVVVLGDFNAPPESPSIAPLMNLEGLQDVLKLKIANKEDRWTYYWEKKRQQLDFILVSKPLQASCIGAGVERQGIYDLYKYSIKNEKAWPEVQNNGIGASASDHAAVWAEFTY